MFEKLLQVPSVYCSLLQKLENAAVIFCTADTQSNRNEVLGRYHASRNTIQIRFNRSIIAARSNSLAGNRN